VHIGRAWDKWRKLTEILRDRKILKTLKVLIYKTVIRPVLLYQAETWPVTDYLAERVSLCEMRMIYATYCLGGTVEEHKIKGSIRRKAKIMNVLEMMRKRRIQWFGHICRKEQKYIRRVHEMKVAGRRNQGRPKHRWHDAIKKHLP